MLFTEPTFLLLFLPLLLALYFASGSRWHGAYANALLLLASLVFYAKGGGPFTWLMLGSIIFNYWMAIAVARLKSDRSSLVAANSVLAFAVTINLVVLGIFKYANFAADNINDLLVSLHAQSIEVPHVLLPIGISFFTFHAISYVVDVYRGDAVAQKSPVHAALYLLLFPQLIAGPIIRYRDIADQLAIRYVGLNDFAYGIRRFVIGLGKKVLVANVVAGPADQIFSLPISQLRPSFAWLGVVCYTCQIYFDFSGYSDMAIGLGRMFGFRFPENFRWPYIAETVQEFWRRWHMSLSAWFRDYLYVPLGGNRLRPARTYLQSGHRVLSLRPLARRQLEFRHLGAFSRSVSRGRAARPGPTIGLLWRPLRHVYLLLVVMAGWVFFRADSLPAAFAFFKAMAGTPASAPTPYALRWFLTPEVGLALFAAVIGSAPVVPWLARRRDRWELVNQGSETVSRISLLGTAALALMLFASIAQIAARTYNPFIYFRF